MPDRTTGTKGRGRIITNTANNFSQVIVYKYKGVVLRS